MELSELCRLFSIAETMTVAILTTWFTKIKIIISVVMVLVMITVVWHVVKRVNMSV